MIYYEPVKVTINAPKLAKVTFDMVVWRYDLPDLIVSNRGLLFIFKFWSLFCYFFGRIALWRPTFRFLTTLSRTIGPGSYRWLSSYITTPRMQALVIRFSSWTVNIIPECLTKKMSTPALSPSQQTNYQRELRELIIICRENFYHA